MSAPDRTGRRLRRPPRPIGTDPGAPGVELECREQLDGHHIEEVRRLVDAATAADGVFPLSEHVLLHLRYGGDGAARHLLARRDGELIGYGHLDISDAVTGACGELAVAAGARRTGVGTALVSNMLALSPDGRLRLWAHGQQPAASALARRFSFARERVLWRMHRSLLIPLPQPSLPDGVRTRAFRPGQDEAAWTALNNAAFAGHPDQGNWGPGQITLREREPWFDPAGFVLAERQLAEPELLGFVWTKVHGAGDHGHDPIGEIYVLGVAPSGQGLGLGRALTLLGLHLLAARGLREAMLYVDESNTPAITLYSSLGFSRRNADVTFARG